MNACIETYPGKQFVYMRNFPKLTPFKMTLDITVGKKLKNVLIYTILLRQQKQYEKKNATLTKVCSQKCKKAKSMLVYYHLKYASIKTTSKVVQNFK